MKNSTDPGLRATHALAQATANIGRRQVMSKWTREEINHAIENYTNDGSMVRSMLREYAATLDQPQPEKRASCPLHGLDYVGECGGCALTLPEKDFSSPSQPEVGGVMTDLDGDLVQVVRDIELVKYHGSKKFGADFAETLRIRCISFIDTHHAKIARDRDAIDRCTALYKGWISEAESASTNNNRTQAANLWEHAEQLKAALS